MATRGFAVNTKNTDPATTPYRPQTIYRYFLLSQLCFVVLTWRAHTVILMIRANQNTLNITEHRQCDWWIRHCGNLCFVFSAKYSTAVFNLLLKN